MVVGEFTQEADLLVIGGGLEAWPLFNTFAYGLER